MTNFQSSYSASEENEALSILYKFSYYTFELKTLDVLEGYF